MRGKQIIWSNMRKLLAAAVMLASTTLAAIVAVSDIGPAYAQVGVPDPPEPATGICDRTEEVQDAILSKLRVDNCADVTDEQLSGITDSLRLSRVSSLRSGDFDGLTGLTHLTLSGGSFTSLPEGIFDGLTSLRSLFVIGTGLSSLPEGVFDDLHALGSDAI